MWREMIAGHHNTTLAEFTVPKIDSLLTLGLAELNCHIPDWTDQQTVQILHCPHQCIDKTEYVLKNQHKIDLCSRKKVENTVV